MLGHFFRLTSENRVMNKNKILFVVLMLFVAMADAHHGTSGQFDQSKSLEVSGTVTKIRFVNPHSYVYFDAVNDQGEVENWRCEMRAATVLKRSGWTKEMFATGTKIKIVGVPAFREPTGCYINTVEFEDGEVVERYQQLAEKTDYSKLNRPARMATGEPNISGDWAAPQRLPTEAEVRAIALGIINNGGMAAGAGMAMNGEEMGMGAAQDTRRGRTTYEQSEEGIAASAGYEREDNPRFACEATNIVFDWVFDQHINRVEQSSDKIIMTYGFMDIVRTIHMDQDKHPAQIQASRAGHSIGKWDGDTLVVETIGFTEGILDSRGGAKHSDQLRITERFTMDPETMSLKREYEGEDPKYLAAKFTGQDEIFFSDTPYDPYNCEDLTEEVAEGF